MTRTTNMVDYSDRVVPAHKCAACGLEYRPAAMGYNAAYCSVQCKRASRSKREDNPLDRSKRRDYMRKYVANRLATDPAFKQQHNARAGKYRKATRDWLAEYKLERGCVDCGFRGHFSALQLDHEGPKSVEIAAARTSVARLQAEIESGQCKVRCANCHSIRTWLQKQKVDSPHPESIGKGCAQ